MVNWKEYNIERKDRFCNINLTKNMQLIGEWEMPKLLAYNGEIPKHYIPFNECIKSKNHKGCVHFFIDDYQFERFWNTPSKYIDILKKFDCVIAPDFSIYLDASKVVNLWNLYRNRLLSAYLIENGINVIPSISWGSVNASKYLYEGMPTGSIIAMGVMGVNNSKHLKEIWRINLEAAIEKIKPCKIILYTDSTLDKLGISDKREIVHVVENRIKRLRKHEKGLCTT